MIFARLVSLRAHIPAGRQRVWQFTQRFRVSNSLLDASFTFTAVEVGRTSNDRRTVERPTARSRLDASLASSDMGRRPHGYGDGSRDTAFAIEKRAACRAMTTCFPCVGETLRQPGDFGYRARVLVFTCERVRANARAMVGAGDATENAAMRMHGDTLKRMIERFGEDVFRVDVFESDGTVKVERRAGERARERVLLWIASLKCPNGSSVPMKLVDEYVGEREVLC